MKKNESGQTLVALLFFVMIGIMATGSAAIVLFTNLLTEQKVQDAEVVRQEAEAGGENALISLLRDSTYSGETIVINNDNVVITVTGGTTKTIDSVATSGDIERKIEITATLNNNVLVESSWKQIY